MNKTFNQGIDEVAKLCHYFANNRPSFLAPGVKEAHVRQSLIDPFFEALGWDMRNAAMTAPQYREVVTEDSLDVEGQQKAPDYTFRLGTLATPKLRGATSESEKTTLQNAFTTTDAEIDRLVYELYGLTEKEIKIMEIER